MLTLKDLSLKILDKRILNPLSFSLNPHQITCLIGPNGAGKSTLLKVLAGIHREYEGSAVFGENELNNFAPKERAKKIAFVGPMSLSLKGLTMDELLNYARYPYMDFYRNLTREESELKAEMIDSFNLKEFLKRDLTTLSSGELQRISLACGFLSDPDLLLIDEGFSHLDPKFKQFMQQKLKDWVLQSNRSIIYITHDINEAVNISQQLLVMKNGELIFKGNPCDAIENKTLDKAYDINFQSLQDQGKFFLYPGDQL